MTVHLRDIRFTYPRGDFKLSVPELSVARGERLGIIGPSGSGKTTLLNIIAGIFVPEQGSVEVDGVTVSALGDDGRRDFRITRIGFVFQDFELLDYLTVFDNILHPYRITSALKLSTRVRDRAAWLAGQMGIGDKLDRYATDLSQGEKQRAAVCRALLPSPSLVLADEATGNLDPENKGRIMDLLYASLREQGAALVAVTHDHELLPGFDRVLDFGDFRQGQSG